MFNSNQEAIHYALREDIAYKWSVDNNSAENMQIVLRAYGYDHSEKAAADQIAYETK